MTSVQREKSDHDRPRLRTMWLRTRRSLHLFFHDTSLLTSKFDTSHLPPHSRFSYPMPFTILHLTSTHLPRITPCFDIGTHISIGIRIGITRTIAHLFPYIQISVFLTPKHWHLHPHHHTCIPHHHSSIEHSHLRPT